MGANFVLTRFKLSYLQPCSKKEYFDSATSSSVLVSKECFLIILLSGKRKTLERHQDKNNSLLNTGSLMTDSSFPHYMYTCNKIH